jgi:pimeloyl-ACP methyl ester carboxylesterase
MTSPWLDWRRMQELLATAQRGRLEVDGCPIAWARWASPSARDHGFPIALVHGAGAHLGWWETVIRLLSDDGHEVVALELSGHGESGHRDAYGPRTWAAEVLAVLREVAGGPAMLVGHSLGGRVAVCAAAADPLLVPRLVLVDAPVRRPGTGRPRALPGRSPARRVHPTLEQAVATFRLAPREPVADRALLQRIALAAFAPCEKGWSLRADLSVFSRIPDEAVAEALGAYPGPLTLIYGLSSAVVDEAGRGFLAEAHAGPTEMIAIEGHHHLTLDQGATLAALLAERHAGLGAPGDAAPRRPAAGEQTASVKRTAWSG